MRFFVYGSLVNAATISMPIVPEPARLDAHAREWRDHRVVGSEAVTGLTISPNPSIAVEGVTFEGDADIRRSLMEREGHPVTVSVKIWLPLRMYYEEAEVFLTPPNALNWASDTAPIPLSYLLCVLQGYLSLYGFDGVLRFINSTVGWHVPFLDDRADPRYPRPIDLSDDEFGLLASALRLRGFWPNNMYNKL